MTETPEQKLQRHYQEVFQPERFVEYDNRRVAFLSVVVEGEFGSGKNRKSLDYLVDKVDEKANPDLVRFLKAAQALRNWYLDPRSITYASVEKTVKDGGSDCRAVANLLEPCAKVLKNYRLDELFGELDKTLNSYRYQKTTEGKAEVVQKVDTIIAIARAFKDNEAFERMIDLAAHYEHNGLYPVSKQPDTYAQRASSAGIAFAH